MHLSKIKKLYIWSFVFSLHIALSAYISSSFLIKFIDEDYVGILYTLASLLTLILLVKSSGILKNFGNKRMVLIFLLINMLALAGLILFDNPYLIGASFILFTTTNTLVLFCIDIFIEHFGDPKTIGKTRGLYLTVENIAWMLSPLIAVFFITKEGGYRAIFILAFIMTIFMTIGLVFSVKTFKDKTYIKTPFLQTFRYLKTNKNMLAIVTISFLLHFFFSWMVVYTPIYFNQHLGFSWKSLGVIFTIMLAPFVILGLPIGSIIDKHLIKKRTLLYIGFSIMILFTVLISFITTKNIWIWAIILFMTRVGASIIQTTIEIYFFSHAKEEDSGLLSVFRDMVPVAYIIAPLLAIVVFYFLPFQYLFTILGIIMSVGLLYISDLAKTNENTIPNKN